MHRFTASALAASAYDQRKLRLAQRERLQRDHDWHRLHLLRPYL